MLAVFTALFLMITAAPTTQMDRRWETVAPYSAKLDRIAACEWRGQSVGWFRSTNNGYYGGLQFKLSTWRAVGGHGYPHQNSIMEQKFRAVLLIKVRGYTPWPYCGSA